MNEEYADIPKPSTDERRLWDIILGNFGYKALLVAHKINLFNFIAEKPQSLAEICEKLKIHQRPAEILLAVNASMGLVQKKDGYYVLTALANDYLIETSPTYFGGFLDIQIANDNAFSFESLKKAVVTNSPQIDQGTELFESLENQAALARTFTQGMHGQSIAAAFAWPEAIDLSGYKLLIDIGGGSGAHSIGATLKWPNLLASILDLAPVCEVAQKYVMRYGLQNRIQTQVCDMWSDRFPVADIHFYSNIYHDWPLNKGRFLTEKSFETLEPGGRIIIHEMLYDDEKVNSFPAAAFSVAMLLWTEGQQYSGRELSAILEEVGFTEIEVKPTFGYWSIVTGRKP